MINVLRNIFIWLDTIIYGILEQIFQLIINLANFDLFSGAILKNFATRIYLILGLVMVFKLMISFIQILIDPDKISDKEKGVGNILKRVIISVILIVLVPGIFQTAKQVQNYVIPLIPKIIVGVPADVSQNNVNSDATETRGNETTDNDEVLISTGRLMSYYSFLPFFYYSDEECNNGHLLGTTEDNANVTIRSVADAVSEVNDKNCPQSKDGYTYNYRMFISTVVGVYLVYVLVTVALKIAIRTIKFGICQLIAPIPIASYIDPGTSKKAFDNWVSTSIKVYLDLFVRLISVYFIIYVFSLLFDGGRIQEIIGKFGWFQGLLVMLFIIVGLLNFAKEMPKFITGMLGISDSFSDIGDMFKGQGWKALGGMAGALASPITTAVGNYRYAHDTNKESVGMSLKRAINGGIASFGRGLHGVANGRGFNDTFWSNVAKTTGNAQRRSNAQAIKAQFHREYEDTRAGIRQNISDVNNRFDQEAIDLDGRRTTLLNNRNSLLQRRNYLQQHEVDLQNDLNVSQGEVDVARDRVSNAQNRRTAAQSSLDSARSTLDQLRDSSRTKMEELVNKQGIKRNELIDRRDLFQRYSDALMAKNEASGKVDYWKRRLNNAKDPAGQEVAREGLRAAISELNAANALVERMHKDDKLSPANPEEVAGWIERTNNAISQLDRGNESEKRRLQVQIDRDINNAEINVTNATNELAAAETELNTANIELSNRETAHQNIQTQIEDNRRDLDATIQQYTDINAEINDVEGQIDTLDDRRDTEISKLESDYDKVREIQPTRDAIVNAINRAQGLSAITGGTYIDASQQLSSVRGSYYTGEAMKKLKEEGTKLDDFHMNLVDGRGNQVTATYSEVASALKALETQDNVQIGGRTYTKSDYQLVQQLFSNAEKDAAQEYIRRVDRGVIQNVAIAEGNKQVYAMLEGLQIDSETKDELKSLFNRDKGKFYKVLSDYSKQLETHGKRLQAYERAKKEKNS